jgi:ABC-2 type transport system ATP-binding protein
LIEARNLSKRYGNKNVLDNISFEIKKGESVGLLGLNGAGKTTLMNILAGCLCPTSGAASIGGYDIVKNPAEAKRFVGYLPELPAFYGEMRVCEYLEFIYDLKKIKSPQGRPSAKRAEHIADICASVGLAHAARRIIRNLSKGYAQRVGFAQALIGDPEVLILDEPTVGLDPSQISEIRTLVAGMSNRRTVVISSHILPEIQSVCNRIIILHGGRIIADGAPGKLGGNSNRPIKMTVRIKGDPGDIEKALNGAGIITGSHQGMTAGTDDNVNAVAGVYRDINSEINDGANTKIYTENNINTASINIADADTAVAKRLTQAPEPGAWDYEFVAPAGQDVREKIFFALAAAGLPLLQTTGRKDSLEDTFLRMVKDTFIQPPS